MGQPHGRGLERLPPETRTVGQLVAETIQLYREHFWKVLPLGAVLAGVNQVSLGREPIEQATILLAAAPLVTAAYVAACAIAVRVRASAAAYVAGVLIFLPVPALQLAYAFPAVAWLAFLGLAVPAAMAERLGVRDALARGRRLGTADYAHAFGGLATLVIVFALSKFALVAVLREQGDNGVRAAYFLADLVLSPLLYLGGALLYVDQAARVVHSRPRTRRTPNADLRDAVDADRAGHPDAPVEPGPAP